VVLFTSTSGFKTVAYKSTILSLGILETHLSMALLILSLLLPTTYTV